MRPTLEVADIFRDHGAAWRKANAGHVSLGQLKVMSAIESCRTAALGGHVARCENCSHTIIAYNSCRNRHCPKCQGAAAREWLAEREAELLPVPYYHVVFTLPAQIADIAIDNVDAFLDAKGRDGWCRVSIATSAAALRSFFRYAEMRGWCSSGIAAAIDAPRLFRQEGLPRGPCWVDVRRLMESTSGEGPRDKRDHAILMLLAIYGLRSGEVRGLRLEDLDWTKEVIRVERPKLRRTQYYPLVASVGDAILRYLQGARPRCTSREVFVTLKAPFRPLSAGGMYYAVANRLNTLDIQTEHHGPHGLRHACAAHLVEVGLSLKEIGDHLGHHSAYATRTYAKVDLGGLREVAAFDLGGLS